MTGAFPSISLKTSSSASSPVLSLYFFLASSPSATLNSSNVMLRQDFFLNVCRKGASVWDNACHSMAHKTKKMYRLNCVSRDRNTVFRFASSAGLFYSLSVEFESWKGERTVVYTEPCVITSTWQMWDTAWRWYPTEINSEKTFTVWISSPSASQYLTVVWATPQAYTHTCRLYMWLSLHIMYHIVFSCIVQLQ